METIQSHVFQNGLPAVYLYSPSAQVFTTILLVGVGSRFETQVNQGLARFYTNVCFQSSEQYPQKDLLLETIDQLGLIIKPTVTPEYSFYYFSSVNERFLSSLNLFINLLFRPSLNEQALIDEKQLSLAEIDMINKTPQFIGLNMLNSAILNHTSLGFDIVGSKEAIQNLNFDILTAFKNKYYVSQNCLLVIVGPDKNFPLASLEQLINLIPPGERQIASPFDFSQTKLVQEKVSQMGKFSYLTFGHLCFGRNTDQRLAQNLLLNILIGGRKSQRLALLKERKLVSLIRPWIKIFSDCGIFLIQANCNSVKEKGVKEEILAQLRDLASGSISQDELEKAKNFSENQLLERLSNNLELGLFYSLILFFNLKEQTPQAVIEKIKSVSLEEINAISQTIFKPEGASWVIIGPGY